MNNDSAVKQMEEPELLTEVPPILKRLAKTVAYAFYEPEMVMTVCVLTKYPCIDEDTLMEKLQFDKRQLRQVLSKLKNDKLVKQRVVKEKQQDTGNLNIYNFYFINYKLFVNVVKYKLDHIRKKLENEEQQARNRPCFQCQQCQKNYSDLEVDRLIDMETGLFKCTFCNGDVEEDASHINTYSSGSSLGTFNEQMEMLYKLLRECENINLAPDVLEPTPSTAALKTVQNKSHGGPKSGWTTDRKSIDLYGQNIQINVGDEVKQQDVAAPKELPVWLAKSTVFNEETKDNVDNKSMDVDMPSSSATQDSNEEGDIMSALLAHESTSKKVEAPIAVSAAKKPESSSDSEPDSSPEISKLNNIDVGVTEVADMADSDDDDQHEITVQVGSMSYALSDINDDIIAKMTEEEHDAYLKLYNDAYEQFY